MTTFVQEGNSIDYTPGADVAAGQVVVQGELVGVATRPIPAGELGALAVAGVFDFAKATGIGTGVFAGTRVYWNAGEGVAKDDQESGANKYLGKTIETANDAADTMRVLRSDVGLEVYPPTLLSAAYASGTGTLTLVFDQNVTANAEWSESELVLHTAAEDVNDWTLDNVAGHVVTLINANAELASPTENTLDWSGEVGHVAGEASGTNWPAVAEFPVTVT